MTTKTVRFPNLQLAMSVMDQSIATLALNDTERAKELQRTQVIGRLKSYRSYCWISIDVESPVSNQLERFGEIVGGEVVKEPPDKELVRFPLAEIANRLALREGAMQTSRILVLHESPETNRDASFANALIELSWHDGFSQECVILRNTESGATQRAVFLTPHAEVSTEALLGIPDCRILDVREGQPAHALPPGYEHPILKQHPRLLEPRGPSSILIWSTETSDGLFVEHEILQETVLQIADLISLSPLEPKPKTLETTLAEPPQISVRFVPDTRETQARPAANAVVVMLESRSDALNPQLLDIFDNTEFGEEEFLSAHLFSEKTGRSDLAPIRHFIQFKTDKPPDIIPTRRTRCYIQSASFADQGISLFIEQGYTCKPDLQTIVPNLGHDHPLIQQLANEFRSEGDQIHLIECGGNEKPVQRVLKAGVPLANCIDGLLLQNCLRSDDTRSVDLLVSKQIAQQLEDRRTENRQCIRETGHIEAQLLNEEVEHVIAELQSLLDEAEKQLQPIATRTNSLRDLITKLENECTSSPQHWWKVSDAVGKVNARILDKRLEWIRQAKSQLDDQERQINEERTKLEKITNETTQRVNTLKLLLASAKKGEVALEAIIAKGNGFGAEIAGASGKAERDYKSAQATMEMFSEKIDEKEQQLLQLKRIVDAERERIEVAKATVAREEDRLASLERRLREEDQALKDRESACRDRRLKAATLEGELTRMRDVEIPELEAKARAAEKSLAGIDERAIRKQTSKAQQKLQQLNYNLSLRREEKAKLTRELQDIQEKLDVEHGLHTELSEIKDALTSENEQLEATVQANDDLKARNQEKEREQKELKARLRQSAPKRGIWDSFWRGKGK